MIEQLIAEATECDFKVALEIKKPKSWLKSVSSFSNGIGGTLFFGISDDRKPIGLSDVQKDAEAISRLIKERITPLPQFILKPLQEDGKNLLALEVSPGRSTPYYYKADGVMEAYIRVGNESVIAPDYIVNELILKGTNQSFDTLTTDAVKKDYSFTLLEATYLERTGLRFEPSDYVSFGLTDKNGLLTNAGKLMTDQHTVYNSRMFCTRWNGLEKGSIFDDALDDKEYDIYSIRSMRRNPVIADLFHRMKYMERRGSGLRKIVSETEKLPGYSEIYKPEFFSTATDFRVILKNVNYHLSQKDLVSDQDCDQVSDQDKSQDILHAVLDFCITEKSKHEICSFIGYRNLTYFTRKYLNPLLASGQLKMTIPDKPNSRKQKYITVHSE